MKVKILAEYDKDFIELTIFNFMNERMKYFTTMINKLKRCEYTDEKISIKKISR